MPCPLCNSADATETKLFVPVEHNEFGRQIYTGTDTGWGIKCWRCGNFVLTSCDRADFLENNTKIQSDDRRKLSSLIRENTLLKLPPIWIRFQQQGNYGQLTTQDPVFGFAHGEAKYIPMQVKELLSNWPQETNARIFRCLCNLVYASPHGGYTIPVGPDDWALGFAVNEEEMAFNLTSLTQQGLINQGPMLDGKYQLQVDSRGWKRFDESRRTGSSKTNPAFVAMWFGSIETRQWMQDTYDKAIALGIRGAGYKATRVDIEPHNDYIMNKVLGDIRIAPFVVADFTGNRNGVYFEAGFARGLGIPVINTCHKDHFDDAHFDTKQLNHIVWETANELRMKLREHIRGTLGSGPFKFDEGAGEPITNG